VIPNKHQNNTSVLALESGADIGGMGKALMYVLQKHWYLPQHTLNCLMQQLSFQRGMNTLKKQLLDKKGASFFYEAKKPLTMMKHPTFLNAMKSTFESRSLYKLPTYYAMCTKLLRFAQEEMA